MSHQSFHSESGITLLEVLVAVGVFSFVIIIMLGIFQRFTLVERRSIQEQHMQEEFRFALELFSREARTAYASSFTLAAADGTNIVFRNQAGACVSYRLGSGSRQLERAEVDFGGEGCLNATFSDGLYAPITGKRVEITDMRFDIPDNIYNVADQRLDRQGFITVMIQARPVTHTDEDPITFQTTVTSRQIIPYPTQ